MERCDAFPAARLLSSPCYAYANTKAETEVLVFIGSLAILFISGITVLAYNDGKTYSKISMPMKVALLCGIMWLFGWEIGRMLMFNDIAEAIGANQVDSARAAAGETELPWWPAPALLAMSLYLLALDRLFSAKQNVRDQKDK